MVRTLAGPFSVRAAAVDWRLRARAASGVELFLRAVHVEEGGGAAFEPARVEQCGAVRIEWLATGAVALRMECAGGPLVLRAAEARLHEGLPELYASLPLAVFDAAARAFWRRVFLIVRLPGGRLLLRALSRRARA